MTYVRLMAGSTSNGDFRLFCPLLTDTLPLYVYQKKDVILSGIKLSPSFRNGQEDNNDIIFVSETLLGH